MSKMAPSRRWFCSWLRLARVCEHLKSAKSSGKAWCAECIEFKLTTWAEVVPQRSGLFGESCQSRFFPLLRLLIKMVCVIKCWVTTTTTAMGRYFMALLRGRFVLAYLAACNTDGSLDAVSLLRVCANHGLSLSGVLRLQQCQAAGYRRIIPLGAPFLYLEQASPKPRSPQSLLVIPFHGWEKEKLHSEMGGMAASIGELEARGFGPITVCLYYTEFSDPEMRAVFERRGYNVVTNGPRGDNPDFLLRQRDLLLSHAYVTSNRVSTAAFYALSLGVKLFMHGPAMGLSGSNDPTGERFDTWQRETFPELTLERFGDRTNRALGEVELDSNTSVLQKRSDPSFLDP